MIVNADSAQLYRDLPILSASPDASDRRRAEHRLYGVADGASAMSAAEWAERARHEIAGIVDSGRLPILVGGSGLYLRTLIDGIAPVPPIDPTIREQVRGALIEDNRARLETLDPEASSRLGPSDKTRIARALEVVLSTGQPLSYWHEQSEGGIGDTISLNPLILLPPRDWLYERCDARFAAMIESGAVDEVAALLKRNLSPSLPVMRAIGVREIEALVSGDMTRAEAIAAGSQATRNYAKRQYTWFAHQPPADWPRFTKALDDLSIAEALDLLGSTD